MKPATLQTPAVDGARRAVRATGARAVVPIDGAVPAEVADSVLLVDSAPSDALLGDLAAALERASAVAIWAPGWDQSEGLAALAAHGLEYGSVDMLEQPQAGMLAVLVRDAPAARRLVAELARPAFSALAIMPAFNEADVIGHAIGALVAHGVDVYLIDHESTDDTAAAATPWLGRGLIAIERFPDDAGYSERNHGEMVWRDILRRVGEVSGEVESDWYLFVNADEFREAPWPATTLAGALAQVDELGYSAVNFELFDFRPTDDRFEPGSDPRVHLRHYEPPGRHDLLQVKAWKRQPHVVDLVHHGGHDVLFEGKRVFPIPFLLRHYPIRSSAHGRRKVLAERLPRFAAEERAGGWHVQYDRYAAGSDFLHDPSSLAEWDGDRVRLELLADATRRLLLLTTLAGIDLGAAAPDAELIAGWAIRRGAAPGVDLSAAKQRLAAAAGAVPADASELDGVAGDLGLLLEAQARLRGDMVLASTLAQARERLLAVSFPAAAPAAPAGSMASAA